MAIADFKKWDRVKTIFWVWIISSINNVMYYADILIDWIEYSCRLDMIDLLQPEPETNLEKIAINCTTEEQANSLVKSFNSKWLSVEKFRKNYLWVYDCLQYSKYFKQYRRYKWWIFDNKIISFEEWMSLLGELIEEEKHSPNYKKPDTGYFKKISDFDMLINENVSLIDKSKQDQEKTFNINPLKPMNTLAKLTREMFAWDNLKNLAKLKERLDEKVEVIEELNDKLDDKVEEIKDAIHWLEVAVERQDKKEIKKIKTKLEELEKDFLDDELTKQLITILNKIFTPKNK